MCPPGLPLHPPLGTPHDAMNLEEIRTNAPRFFRDLANFYLLWHYMHEADKITMQYAIWKVQGILPIKIVIHSDSYPSAFYTILYNEYREIPDYLVYSVKHYFRYGTGLPRGGTSKGGQTSSCWGGGGARMQPTATRGPDVGFPGDNMHWHR